jgi:phosphopantetheinyl transferase
MLTKLWTAKEAIFKSYGKSGLSFSKQMNVLPFKSDEISGKALVIDNGVIKHFSLIFVNLRGYYATIALPK